MILDQFRNVGQELSARGLVPSHNGNMSIRLQDRLIITRRGCRLSCLEENDLIETGITKNDRCTPLASTELTVHRAIYQLTPATAIIHAHPPHAIALSMTDTEIVPTCAENKTIIGEVPVLGWNMEVKPGGLEDVISRALAGHLIVMVRGHGSFAIGQLLEEACSYTTTLEESCQVICLLKSIGTSPVTE
jgi:L-fuculose-phosphate aldolase